MDLSQSFNLNTAPQNPLFEPTYLNLEYIFNKILEFFRSIFGFGGGEPSQFMIILKWILFFLAVFFLFMIAYCLIRMDEIRKKEKEKLKYKIDQYARHQAEREKASAGHNSFRNERWGHVLGYLSSPNESDWKLAVIEADSMLEDLTDQMELEGASLGERLKTLNRDKFKSLDDAWEAHLVRNKIAHEGAQFEISQHEANRVVTLYENAFREFGYI